MAATTDLIAGDRIGNYRIELELACDGLGVTYRAVHLVLPRRAVVRVMHDASSQSRVVHMLREACILDALHHPGIIRVYESGLTPDRRPWFACELVDGPSLASTLLPAAHAPAVLDRVDALSLLRDLVGVIEHAHCRGVIHCGLHPSRVLLTGHSRGYPLCIADWSQARTHDAAPTPYLVTPQGVTHAAPELARGGAIDDRADVYSLGVIAYELLSGALPGGPRLSASAAASLDDGEPAGYVPIAVRCPDAPRELAVLVDQMLARDPWDRPSSTEVHTELTWIVEALAVAMVRAHPQIRRPRWTPPIAFSPSALLAGERGAFDRATTERDDAPGDES